MVEKFYESGSARQLAGVLEKRYHAYLLEEFERVIGNFVREHTISVEEAERELFGDSR